MDARTLLHTYIIPNAGPIATVFAASVAAVVAATFGTLQWSIAKKQAETAQTSVQNALKLGSLQLEIAKQQAETAGISAKTARNKLRLDLFARRIEMHDAVLEWISLAPGQGTDVTHFGKLLNKTREVKWLFPEHVSNWIRGELSEAYQAMLQAKTVREYHHTQSEKVSGILDESAKIHAFLDQNVRLHEEFSPYLTLEE